MFKKLKNNLPKKAPVPRELPEIEAENEKLCSHAGKVQYQIHVLQKDLDRTNDAIMNCNYEAAARNELNNKKEENKNG